MGIDDPWFWLLIAVLFILLFGAKRLPDGARSLGRSLRIFKSEIRGLHDDDDEAAKEHAQAVTPTPAPLPAAPVTQVVQPAPPPAVQVEAPPAPPATQPTQPASTTQVASGPGQPPSST